MAGISATSVIQCEVIQALEDSGATINIFVICLDRPHSDHNIIDRPFGYQLARVVYLAREKVKLGEIDLVVVCSAKEGSFMSGADIETQLKYVGVEGQQNAHADLRKLQNIFCYLECLPVPTIAVMNGISLGGGLELALSCDFRIADSILCKQIGFPEVRIGVLPGAGGCVRLPRLIGFRQSLDLIVTGASIHSSKALKLGIVDQLADKTQSIFKSTSRGGSSSSYEYEWLSCVLNCVEKKKVGGKPLLIRERDGATAVSASVNVEKFSDDDTEEIVLSSLSENWEDCERKSEAKYPRKSGLFRSFYEFLLNVLFYTVAVFRLWRKVGFKMPSPYASLQTTFRCYYAGSWLEAMILNSQAMGSLIVSPESKGLMFLFLITRKLKKIALHFGLKSNEDTSSFSDESSSIVVLISKEFLALSSPFVQGLLYNNISTTVITEQGLRKTEVIQSVRNHFKYALKRRYISQKEVDIKMSLLVCLDCITEMENHHWESGNRCLIVISASNKHSSLENIAKHYDKVISVALFPSVSTQSIPFPLLMNVGDPHRKNTLTVEITPLTQQTPPEYLRILSSFVSALGKIPVLTPPTSLTACGLHILLSHWSLAVSLVGVYGGNVTAKKIDKTLVAMGYGIGPFQAMEKFGKVYFLRQEDWKNKNVHFNRLNKFIATGTIPSSSKKKNLTLSDEQISNLFTFNLALASFHARTVTKGLNEVTVDVLCVTGLVQFPPTESGPLNFVTRLGMDNSLRMFGECVKVVPFLVEVNGAKKNHIASFERHFQDLFKLHADNVETSTQSGERLDELFQSHRSEVILLSQKELKLVGRCGGVQNRELFLLPVTVGLCVVMGVCVLALSVIVVCLYVALLELVLVQ